MSSMKTAKSAMLHILGVALVALGSIVLLVTIAGLTATIQEIGNPENNGELFSIFLVLFFSALAYFLLYSSVKVFRRGKLLREQVRTEKNDRELRQQELLELEHRSRLEAQKEEAHINEQKLRMEQLKLQAEIDELERKRAVELEAKRKIEEQQRIEKERLQKEDEIRAANKTLYLTPEQVQNLESGIELPVLNYCELLLQRGEVAVYGCVAERPTSKGADSAIGSFYITTQRIAFICEEQGFVIPHREIIAVTQEVDGMVFQSDHSAVRIFFKRPELAYIVFDAVRAGHSVPSVHDNTYIDDCDNTFDIDGMEGHDFEYFCASLLQKNGFTDVEVTKGSGDQGVDILATKGGIKYAIQCKNYSSKLSNKPVQEVHAGKDMYKCHVGVVMTNSTFTPSAQELAASTNVLLWDRSVLEEMISNCE